MSDIVGAEFGQRGRRIGTAASEASCLLDVCLELQNLYPDAVGFNGILLTSAFEAWRQQLHYVSTWLQLLVVVLWCRPKGDTANCTAAVCLLPSPLYTNIKPNNKSRKRICCTRP